MMQDPTVYFTLKEFYQAVKSDCRVIGHLIASNDHQGDSIIDGDRGDAEMIMKAINSYDKIKSVTYCKGSSISSNVGNDVFLRLKLDDGSKITQDISYLKPKYLAKYMDRAPFGDLETQTTVIDENVRTAYQTEMENVEFLVGGKFSPSIIDNTYVINNYLPDFFKRIHLEVSDLFGGDGFVFSPYRLNVYGPGGFFKPHVDTPKNADMIGTLVLILPSEYTGGELIVSHNGDSTTYDFSDKNSIHWVTFFSDCVHEVKPITSGYRASITFNIVKHKSRHSSKNSVIHPEYSHYGPLKRTKYNNFGDIIVGTTDMYNYEILSSIANNQYDRIGIILSHNYTPDGLNPDNLKGYDKFLYDHINSEYSCKLSTVLIYHNEEESYDGDLEYRSKIYQLDVSDWPYYYEHRKINPDPEPLDSDYDFISFAGLGRIIERREQKAAFTGNQSEYGYDCRTYFSAAILIDK